MLIFARPQARIFALRKTSLMKDSIDFGSMDIPKLFRKLLIPTVLGMIFSAVFVITDGIFVGRGIGSDALAAVNITAPLFLISTGVGLMFGVGASVVASIHLSQGKVKVARINVTQAVVVSSLLLATYSFLITWYAPAVARLLGSSDRLLLLAVEYMHWFAPFLPFSALLSSGMFFIRLDGSPNYAMLCNAVPAVINIALDYVFIFIFGWGMTGAALATSLGYIVGAGMILVYLSGRRRVVRFCRVKLSRKSMRLTLRNVEYMCRLGLSTFLCEGAIATMMFAGNYVFIRYLGEDGVAAFSIACYFFPIIFMVYNAIGQSAQPILSYNFGAGNDARVRKAFRLALMTALTAGLGFFGVTALFSREIVAMFIDSAYPAYDIAVRGLPLFASGFVFFAVNIVVISYFQSVERARPAMLVTLLRGFVFMVLCFFGLPLLLDVEGIWLAVPLAEVLTFGVVMAIYYRTRLKSRF
jgi:Na+-driven multidrug efflux pump